MSIPHLRPCRVRTESNYTALPDVFADGNFHQWAVPRYGVVAIVELLDGQVITVAPENFWFTDREGAPEKLPQSKL